MCGQDPSASRSSNQSQDASELDLDEEHAKDSLESARTSQSCFKNVGKVVWQSGFLLADYLIRMPPMREWVGVRVVDLGTGTGKTAAACQVYSGLLIA